MISLTEKAHSHIISLIPKEMVLRIAIIGGGCSGYSYKMEFIQESLITPKDFIHDMGLFKIIVDKRSMVFLKDTVIDFSDGLNGKGISFVNPNAKSSCGCGQSFSS